MRIETVEKKIYNFDDIKNGIVNRELKEKILDNFRGENNLDFDFIAESFLENKKSELEKLGYNDIKIMYSGFWSQGDGACFTAESIDILNIIKRAEIFIKFNLNDILYNNFSSQIKHNGRYYHENSIYFDYDFSYTNYNNIDIYLESIIEKIENFIDAEIKQLSKKIYNELYKLYYETETEDFILETIKANDYEFYENGEFT